MKIFIYYQEWNAWVRINDNSRYFIFATYEEATAFPDRAAAEQVYAKYGISEAGILSEDEARVISILKS